MTIELIKFAFTAGELAPRFYNRTDLEKFDFGLARGENWFVDYRGGLSTRAGQEFIDYVWKDDKPTKFVPFRFSPDIENNYVVLFGDLYIRFIQDGGYILEEPLQTITAITSASPGVMSVVNSFSVGDWLKVLSAPGMDPLVNEIVTVLARTGTTVTMGTIDGTPYNTTSLGTFTGGGSLGRVYTVTSPYAAADLQELQAHQIRDTVRLTHRSYPIYNLKRVAPDDWTLAKETFGSKIGRPSNLQAFSVHGPGPMSVGYIVTAVDKNDEEGLPSDMAMLITNDWNNPTAPGGSTLKWNPVNNARYYNVYRTILLSGVSSTQPTISRSEPVGFLSRALGAYFADSNIVPDFTRTPPQRQNPFADGAIEHINIENSGSGYAVDCGITITDPTGAGFVGFPLVDVGNGGTSGPIKGIMIINGGHDYTNPSFSITGASGGTGLDLSFVIGPIGGNFPATSAVFQQRQEYAGTENDPLKLWGSKPGLFSNYDTSQITVADDSYEFEVDSEDVAPIRHMIPTRGGLLLMTQTGIWQLTGSGGNTAVMATNPVAEPQAYKGVNPLVPVRIDADIVYLEAKGSGCRMLTYEDNKKIYTGTDLTVLSNHLLNPQRTITAWAYADEPFKSLWCRRADGAGLILSILKEHEVFAWTPQSTQGLYEDVVSVEENGVDRVYFMVTRTMGDGKVRKLIERQAPRMFTNAEDAICMDCALVLPATYVNQRLQVATATGKGVLATSTTGTPFVAGDVGSVIRGGGGKMNVVEFVDSATVKVDIIRDIAEVTPGTGVPKLMLRSTWTLDKPVTVVGGCKHLIGLPIKVLADGNYIPGLTVSSRGEITLPQPASRVAVGLGFRCVAQSLPMGFGQNSPGAITPLEYKRQRIVGVAMRMVDSRGLQVGTSEDNVYQMKDRTEELWGEPTKLFKGLKYMGVEPIWETEASLFFVQDDPLPASIVGFVTDADIGDQDQD